MSDDDLRRALSDAEAGAQRVVTAPGVEAVHRTLRRRRRDRAVLAVLLVAAVISGTVAVLAARAESPVPPINRNTPSARPNIIPSEDPPSAQAAAAPETTTTSLSSSAPKTPCTSNLIAVHEGGTRVRALDITGRAMPICGGAVLRVRLDTYQIDPGTTVARINWGAQETLESSQPAVTFPLQTPPGCSWWVITASNTMLPPGNLDLADYKAGTPQSPFWDQASGRDGQIASSSWTPCPSQSWTPTP